MPLSAVATPLVQLTSSPIVFIALLTFSLPGHVPLYVANNSEDVVSRGNTYIAYPFQVVLPNDDSERLPQVGLRIDNVAGEIMEYIRSLPQAPTMLLEVVTNVDFDVVEKSVGFLKLEQVSYNAVEVTGTLTLDNFLTKRFPMSDYDPVHFPAMFVV
jgi:hypothetical protein